MKAQGQGAPMTGPLLSVRNLEVRYGDLIGVADVSLDVPQGGVVALLGSNGAGKTTTLNAIACTPCSRNSASAAVSVPARCRAANARCWRSAAP